LKSLKMGIKVRNFRIETILIIAVNY